MRKLLAIATMSIVGVLTLSGVAFAAPVLSNNYTLIDAGSGNYLFTFTGESTAGTQAMYGINGLYPTTYASKGVSANGGGSCDSYVGTTCTESFLITLSSFTSGNGTMYVCMPNGCAGDPSTSAKYYVPFYVGSSTLMLATSSNLTRIVSVSSPQNETSTTSTNVTFSGTYYARSTDFASSTYDAPPYINLLIMNMSDTSTTTLNDTYLIKQRITQFDQVVSFSTTTTLINNSRYAWQFTISGTSAINGQSVNNFTDGMPDGLTFFQFIIGTFDSTQNLSFDLSSCNVLVGFDMNDCLYNLLFPNNVVYPLLFQQAKNSYGRAFPIGYVTRFLEILSASSTVALPTISYRFATTSPLYSTFSSDPIEFDPFGALVDTNSPLNWKSDQATQLTFWQIITTPITYLLYITLLFLIIHDLTGIMKHRK